MGAVAQLAQAKPQAPKSVVLLKRICSSRCQDCILALPVLLLFVAILVFLSAIRILDCLFHLLSIQK